MPREGIIYQGHPRRCCRPGDEIVVLDEEQYLSITAFAA
jgi:hypothetical protein